MSKRIEQSALSYSVWDTTALNEEYMAVERRALEANGGTWQLSRLLAHIAFEEEWRIGQFETLAREIANADSVPQLLGNSAEAVTVYRSLLSVRQFIPGGEL